MSKTRQFQSFMFKPEVIILLRRILLMKNSKNLHRVLDDDSIIMVIFYPA